jgi:hypothetical protein
MEQATYPRVGSLRYFIRTSRQHSFAKEATDAVMVGPFSYSLRFYSAEFSPLKDFARVEDARRVLEPLLQAWQVSALLLVGPAGFTFEFSKAFLDDSATEMQSRIDNRPKWPPGPPQLKLQYDSYAAPIPWLVVDDCVRDLSEHYLAAQLSPRARLLHGYAIATRVKAVLDRKRGRGKTADIS